MVSFALIQSSTTIYPVQLDGVFGGTESRHPKNDKAILDSTSNESVTPVGDDLIYVMLELNDLKSARSILDYFDVPDDKRGATHMIAERSNNIKYLQSLIKKKYSDESTLSQLFLTIISCRDLFTHVLRGSKTRCHSDTFFFLWFYSYGVYSRK